MRFIKTTAIAALVIASQSAYAGTPVISLSVGGEISPGVYGQVQFGNAPPPAVLNPQPVIIQRQPAAAPAAPLYLHVPPGHAKKWAKHCHKYNACNQSVYFVKSAEYESDDDNRDDGRKRHGRGEEKHGDKGSKGKGRSD